MALVFVKPRTKAEKQYEGQPVTIVRETPNMYLIAFKDNRAFYVNKDQVVPEEEARKYLKAQRTAAPEAAAAPTEGRAKSSEKKAKKEEEKKEESK